MRKPPPAGLAVFLSVVLGVGAWPPPPVAAAGPSVDRALDRARERAARDIGIAPAKVVTLGASTTPVRIGIRTFATGVFADASFGKQRFLAVDVATGEILDADAFAAETHAAGELADRFSPAARSDLSAARGKPVLLAFALRPLDYGPAVAAYRKGHADVTWDGDRPVSVDRKLVESRRVGVLKAKVAKLVDGRAAFLEAVSSEGATVVTALDLVPMVYVRADAATAERLAARPEVGQVLQPDTYELAMSSARSTIDADLADQAGLDGSGVKIGIVEYSYVSWGHTGLTSVPRTSVRVSASGTGCLSGRGTNGDSVGHMTWVTAIAASRAASRSGVANDVFVVEASANSGRALNSSDPRILKAAECAVLSGATVLNLSIVQNNRSTDATSNRFFDELIDQHGITVVAASGDHGPGVGAPSNPEHCTNHLVRSPASAWNVVAVGGTDDRGTSSTSDDRLWWRSDGTGPAYCWGDPPGMPWDALRDREKPELSAPAVGITTSTGHSASGTSASSPMVAAAVATLMENDPELRYRPERVRAILVAASAYDRTPRPSGGLDTETEGWGSLNVLWSNRVADQGTNGANGQKVFTGRRTGNSSCPYGAPGRQTVDFSGRSGRFIRFVVTWNSHNVGGLSQRTSDYTLTIRNPDGDAIAVSARNASNYEVVEFRVDDRGGPGTYRAEITPVRWQCYPSAERVGWAFVSF
jgi:subtilase family protein